MKAPALQEKDVFFSIIIPAFNEGDIIKASLEETVKVFNDFDRCYEIIVVDDGSRDETFSAACQIACQHKNIKVKRNFSNYGKGRAIKKAFRYVDGNYVVFLDADLELHPGQVETLFDILRLNEADVVIGSKLHPNSKVEYPLSRKIVSVVYYMMIKMLFGLPVHDTQTGLKIFKTDVLRRVFPKILVKKFAFDLEILVNAQRLGYKIAEAPIVLERKRKYGRIGWRAFWQTGVDTLAIFYRMFVLKYYEKDGEEKK